MAGLVPAIPIRRAMPFYAGMPGQVHDRASLRLDPVARQ